MWRSPAGFGFVLCLHAGSDDCFAVHLPNAGLTPSMRDEGISKVSIDILSRGVDARVTYVPEVERFILQLDTDGTSTPK